MSNSLTDEMQDIMAAWETHLRRAEIILPKHPETIQKIAEMLEEHQEKQAADDLMDVVIDLLDLWTNANNDTVRMFEIHKRFVAHIAKRLKLCD